MIGNGQLKFEKTQGDGLGRDKHRELIFILDLKNYPRPGRASQTGRAGLDEPSRLHELPTIFMLVGGAYNPPTPANAEDGHCRLLVHAGDKKLAHAASNTGAIAPHRPHREHVARLLSTTELTELTTQSVADPLGDLG